MDASRYNCRWAAIFHIVLVVDLYRCENAKRVKIKKETLSGSDTV